jgi:hypothetical protein
VRRKCTRKPRAPSTQALARPGRSASGQVPASVSAASSESTRGPLGTRFAQGALVNIWPTLGTKQASIADNHRHSNMASEQGTRKSADGAFRLNNLAKLRVAIRIWSPVECAAELTSLVQSVIRTHRGCPVNARGITTSSGHSRSEHGTTTPVRDSMIHPRSSTCPSDSMMGAYARTQREEGET